MLTRSWLSELQALAPGALTGEPRQADRVAVVIGESPSLGAGLLKLWRFAGRAVGLEAACLPVSVPGERLRPVIELLRGAGELVGGSVAGGHRSAIVPLLDELDPAARRVGAVNVIARSRDGRLVGGNTEGVAGLRALTHRRGRGIGLGELASLRVLIIGSGSVARALAFALWERLIDGELIIAGRRRAAAEELARQLSAAREGRVSAIGEEQAPERLAWLDLVINASAKGQAGMRELSPGRWSCLEPYSALGRAEPAVLAVPAAGDVSELPQAWYRASSPDIQRNHQASLQGCARLPRSAICCDVIDEPAESVFLRHGRWSGHRTLNGRAMRIFQAAAAFEVAVDLGWPERPGRGTPEARERIEHAMWDACDEVDELRRHER